MAAKKKTNRQEPIIERFDFKPGRILARKYEVIAKLGEGWEAEVYHVREISTGIERAAKLFFPERNVRDKTTRFHAKKMHKLRHCPILIQYHTQETIVFKRAHVTFMVSEFVDGELLSDYLKRQPGKRLHYFQALHILYELASGMECIHNHKDYHGDLHDENIIVQQTGVGFDLKVLDMFHWGTTQKENVWGDVVNMIHLFYQMIGGKKHYASMPPQVKDICCGLKSTIILKKFRSAGQLREYMDYLEWN